MSENLAFQGYNWGALALPGDTQVRLIPDCMFKTDEESGGPSPEQREQRLKKFILTLQNVRGQLIQLDEQLQGISKESLKKAWAPALAEDLAGRGQQCKSHSLRSSPDFSSSVCFTLRMSRQPFWQSNSSS